MTLQDHHQEDRRRFEAERAPRMTVVHEGGRTGIQCHDCNLTSWNLNDVAHTYCANCHRVGTIAPRRGGAI